MGLAKSMQAKARRAMVIMLLRGGGGGDRDSEKQSLLAL